MEVGILTGADAAGFEPDTPGSYPLPPTYPARLPSGAKVLLQQPDIISLMQRGDVPNPLIGVVKAAFDQRELVARARETGRTVEEQQEWEALNDVEEPDEPDFTDIDGLAFIDLLVIAAVLKPELSADPPADRAEGRLTADGKLSLSALPPGDKLWIFGWVNERLEPVARFREDGTLADSEPDGGAVRAEAGGSAGDPGHTGEPVAAVLRG